MKDWEPPQMTEILLTRDDLAELFALARKLRQAEDALQDKLIEILKRDADARPAGQ